VCATDACEYSGVRFACACARIYTFALRQDHGRGRVCAVADACYGYEVCLSPSYVVGIMTKQMLHIIFYTERVKSVRAYISVVRAYIRDGHGLMTTVEFPCNPLRTLSPHDTYRGWNSDAHATMLPRRRHVGYVHHVMLTQELSSFISSAIL